MEIDVYEKSEQLLAALANSIHDRESQPNNPFTFSISEIHVAEKWLMEFATEIKRDCVCV